MANKPKHAELSGSTAHRWIPCPGSIRLTRGVKDTKSPAAREGTTAHALGEQILAYWKKTRENIRGLRQRFKAGMAFKFEDHGEKLEAIATEDMLDAVFIRIEHVLDHASQVSNPTSRVHTEMHVSLERLVRDNMYGTADDVIDRVNSKLLVVTDYKHGFLPVHIGTTSDPNAQLMYYAAGALDAFDWRHQEVELNIIQPRSMEVESVQTLEMTSILVREWVDDVLYPAAFATDAPDAPLVAGEWCRFCPAQATCPAQVKLLNEAAGEDFLEVAEREDMPDIPENPVDLARVLRAAGTIDAWLRACEDQAHALLAAGKEVPGFKLVRKRSNRAWPDVSEPELYRKLLRAGLDKKKFSIDALFDRKLLSPAQLEKRVGKDIVNEVAEKPDTGTTVAAESDKREAVGPGNDDFKELM